MNINEFKKGDFITRVEPSKRIGDFQDRSGIGDKFKFIGIANGCAYCQQDESECHFYPDDMIVNFELDIYHEGWCYWVDPKHLLNTPSSLGKEKSEKDFINKFKEFIELCISNEDYESLQEIKDFLDDLNKVFKNVKMK